MRPRRKKVWAEGGEGGEKRKRRRAKSLETTRLGMLCIPLGSRRTPHNRISYLDALDGLHMHGSCSLRCPTAVWPYAGRHSHERCLPEMRTRAQKFYLKASCTSFFLSFPSSVSFFFFFFFLPLPFLSPLPFRNTLPPWGETFSCLIALLPCIYSSGCVYSEDSGIPNRAPPESRVEASTVCSYFSPMVLVTIG